MDRNCFLYNSNNSYKTIHKYYFRYMCYNVIIYLFLSFIIGFGKKNKQVLGIIIV